MFHFLIGHSGRELVASNRLILASRMSARTPHIVSGLLPWPISWAETNTGYVFMANGFMPLMKWRSTLDRAVTVGVPAPTTALTIEADGTGDIAGTYYAYVRWIDVDGNPSNLSPISSELDTIQDPGVVAEGEVPPIVGAAQIDYSDVPTTDDVKVARVQILRNTNGQTRAFYVDVDSTDLTGTTFSSTRTDSELSAQEIVPLFDAEGRSIANRYGIPPTHIAFIESFQGRIFGAGVIEYLDGHAETTFGSATVNGIGTSWVTAMEGREFHVSGHDEVYTIETVSKSAQTLTLDRAYAGETDVFAEYKIMPPAIQRRLVYFAEANTFDAWPATNAFEIEENGDDVSGLTSAESFLFVLQKRHIYRMTYSVNPVLDGGVFLAADRGCINNRCWVKIESTIYLMDELGVYSFTAGGEPEPVSIPVQDLYWQLGGESGRKVNWRAQRYFHAVLSAQEATIRWYISLDGSPVPRAALCFNYLAKSWWLEEMPVPIGASCLWRKRADASLPIVAGPARRVFALGRGKLDCASPSGTVRSTATSATYTSITDTAATFAEQVGAPLFIVDGTGRGQMRLIVDVDGTTLNVNRPWMVHPDSTSIYQIGGINWLWRGMWSRWLSDDMSNVRKIIFVYEPSLGIMLVRVFVERQDEPQTWGYDSEGNVDETNPVTVRAGDTDLAVDLAQTIGYAAIRMDSRGEGSIIGRDFFQLEMEGCKGLKPVVFYEVIIEGAAR